MIYIQEAIQSALTDSIRSDFLTTKGTKKLGVGLPPTTYFFVHGKHGKRGKFVGLLLCRISLLWQNSCVPRPALRNCVGGIQRRRRGTMSNPR
jgi:hypothetical protein